MENAQGSPVTFIAQRRIIYKRQAHLLHGQKSPSGSAHTPVALENHSLPGHWLGVATIWPVELSQFTYVPQLSSSGPKPVVVTMNSFR